MSKVKRILWVSLLLGVLLGVSSLVAAAEPEQPQAITLMRDRKGWLLEKLAERLGMTEEELVKQLDPRTILRRLAEERGIDGDQLLGWLRERLKERVTENQFRPALRWRAGNVRQLPRLAPAMPRFVPQRGVVISPPGFRFTVVRPFGWAAPRVQPRIVTPHVQAPRILAPGIGQRGFDPRSVIERWQAARPRLERRDQGELKARPRIDRDRAEKQAPEADAGEQSEESAT